jgi:hypothetical protein
MRPMMQVVKAVFRVEAVRSLALTPVFLLTCAAETGFGQVAERPFVSVLVEGKLAAGFQAEANPIPDVLTSPSRVMIRVGWKDVRLADGQIVNGFGFNGWQEGSGVLVVMSALVPADGTNRYVERQPGVRPEFSKREFVRFTVPVGQSRTVEEMKALGLEPFTCAPMP